MKKIERPWPDGIKSVNVDTLNTWFDEEMAGNYLVEESDLVEVFGNERQFDFIEKPLPDAIQGCTHKAYLIKSSIEPIEQESLKDVVSEIIECAKSNYRKDVHLDSSEIERLERALKVENDRV